MLDKAEFAQWMTHLGVCVGRPVDKATLTSYWLELKDDTEPDELAEAVHNIIQNWTDGWFPRVAHIRKAIVTTRARRARTAIRCLRKVDLQGFTLTDQNVKEYAAWKIRANVEDTEAARALLVCDLESLLTLPEVDATTLLRQHMGETRLPQLSPTPEKQLPAQLSNPVGRSMPTSSGGSS